MKHLETFNTLIAILILPMFGIGVFFSGLWYFGDIQWADKTAQIFYAIFAFSVAWTVLLTLIQGVINAVKHFRK